MSRQSVRASIVALLLISSLLFGSCVGTSPANSPTPVGQITSQTSPTASPPTPFPTASPIATIAPTPTLSEAIALAKRSVVRVQTKDSVGSGVVVDGDGHVLTNSHVVEGASVVGVSLGDGRTASGDVIARDEARDLAVIKVFASWATPIKIGDSENVSVGDEVIAIGFPLGLVGDATATKGMLSAKRVKETIGLNYLQIDAAINPGNSGGALINRDGELIGINTSGIKVADGEVPIEGIGFAIAIDDTKPFVATMISNGRSSIQAAAVPTPPNPKPTSKSAPTPAQNPAPAQAPDAGQNQPPAPPKQEAPALVSAQGGLVVRTVWQDGAPLVGAIVQLQNGLRGRTDGSGSVKFDNLPPGIMGLNVGAPGCAWNAETAEIMAGKVTEKAFNMSVWHAGHIVITSPAPSIHVSTPPTFTWQPYPGETTYRVFFSEIDSKSREPSARMISDFYYVDVNGIQWTVPAERLSRGKEYEIVIKAASKPSLGFTAIGGQFFWYD